MKSIVLSIIFLLSGLSVFAQNKISGTVVDHKTGETLIGVAVKHIGSGKEVLTDFDGQFTISGVDDGENQLKISYVSYEESKLNRVLVKEGEVLTLKIKLRRASQSQNTQPLLATGQFTHPES